MGDDARDAELRREVMAWLTVRSNDADGPMLRHGLQDHHGQRLRVVPAARSEQPSAEMLERRHAQFRAAG